MENRLPELTIIIPHRMSEDASETLEYLDKQTYRDFKIIVVPDEGRGACWARNEGFKQCDTEFVLFSDNDIMWKSRALETMMRVLKNTPKASWVYGRYLKGNGVFCHRPWDPNYLRFKDNYISTMSIVRTKDLPNPPFDEAIKRFQDWDLWLTMLDNGKRGVYCNDLIFETKKRPGITMDNTIDDDMAARDILRIKHGIQVTWRQDIIAA